jgi:hypothetical protein
MAALAAGAQKGAATAGPATSAHAAIASAVAMSKRCCMVWSSSCLVAEDAPLPANGGFEQNLRWA